MIMAISVKPYFMTVLAVSALFIGGIAVWSWSWGRRKQKGMVKLRRRREGSVHVVSTPSQWEECLSPLQQEMEKMKVIGLDCEWVLKHRVALLQISTQSGYCVLVRLCRLAPNIPRSLTNLLGDKSILKVGVAVKDDARKLMRDYCIPAAGCIDLRHMLTRIRGVYMCRSWGLQGLAKTVLNVNLSKDPAVRCGDWEAQILSSEQTQYAAADAIVAVDIFMHLILAKVLGKDPRLHPSEAQAVTMDTFWVTVRSLCQGIVDVGYKFHRESHTRPSGRKQPTERKQSGEAYSTRKRPLWDNCQLLAPDGQLLCTCDTRKAAWYINKELGDKVNDDPLTVKLRFEPSSRPKSERNYYLQDKENMCVVCGSMDSYARKFVVPQEYRKYFPHLLKAHTSHDVLLMCPPCHRRSSDYDGALRFQLAEECGAPLDSGPNSRVYHDHDLQHVRSAARALKANRDKIPEARVRELEKVLYDFYGVPTMTSDILDSAANIDAKQFKENFESHAQRVVMFMAEHDGLLQFQARWRRHFVSTMQPQFLPAFWSVDYVPENWGDQGEGKGQGEGGRGTEGEAEREGEDYMYSEDGDDEMGDDNDDDDDDDDDGNDDEIEWEEEQS